MSLGAWPGRAGTMHSWPAAVKKARHAVEMRRLAAGAVDEDDGRLVGHGFVCQK